MRLLIILLLACLPGSGAADDWPAIESPTAIVLMRHALAPGTGDPGNFAIDDCDTQRNLDQRGRDQAAQIGAELRDRGLTFDAVWTSQWCRCRDTAQLLGVASVEDMPPLNSFFRNRSQGPAQSAALLERLESWDRGRLMLVTHQVNITALTDVFPASGEMIITELQDGALVVTGQIEIAP